MLDEGTSNSVYESFEKAYLENKEKLSLNSDDYKILEDFFKTLGSSGISGQENRREENFLQTETATE